MSWDERREITSSNPHRAKIPSGSERVMHLEHELKSQAIRLESLEIVVGRLAANQDAMVEFIDSMGKIVTGLSK